MLMVSSDALETPKTTPEASVAFSKEVAEIKPRNQLRAAEVLRP
jgi:hypothetical protein